MFVDTFIRRPILASVCSLVIILAGAIAIPTLPIAQFPELAPPQVSVGIISAKNRIWGKAIQTDAKISPSNYGGPLIDLQGRVLGVLVPMSPDRHTDLGAPHTSTASQPDGVRPVTTAASP